MVLNAKFEFVSANAAYLQMVGKSLDDLLGAYVFDAFPETEDRIDHMLGVFQDALAGKDAKISEIPFRIAQGGTVKEQWWTAHHSAVGADQPEGPYLVQFGENVTEAVKMREMRAALMSEMQHRIGNLFTMVNAIARQTGRSVSTIPDFLDEFEARMGSLADLNRDLRGALDGTASIASVLESQLAVYAADARDRITIDGPPYALSLLQSQAVSMAVHELATNSMKYGAIGQPNSTVAIAWHVFPDQGCVLRWIESGITHCETTGRPGFGTTLLTTIVPNQLDGHATRSFGNESFTYELTIGASQ